MNKKALGIDFGTSNSYFSEVSGDVPPRYEDLKFHSADSTVPTCVLYQKSNGVLEPVDFGQSAIDTWIELEEHERKQYEFHSGFKPDIAHNPESFRHAVSFFLCIKKYFDNEGLNYFDFAEDREIVVGIPAKNIKGQEEQTKKVFREAGLPSPILVAEPQGALFYHLLYDRQKLTLDKAHEGVIVIDFGGGTLDIAYLKNCEVKCIWGNPIIGGRLFDDVFFQWFLEQANSPDVLKKIEEDGNLPTVMNWTFRRLKERFSEAWENKKLERFRDRVTAGIDYDYGVFKSTSVDEFFEKIRNYKISNELLNHLTSVDDPILDDARKGKNVNLLQKIREEIQSENADDVTTVILTGGSCRWPFMKEIVQEIFPKADVFRSNNPEATISRGLGTKVIMDQRTKRIVAKLSDNKDVLQKKLMEVIDKQYEKFMDSISRKFLVDFFELKVKKAFVEWRENGGTAESLEKKTESLANEYFSYEAKQLIEARKKTLQSFIKEKVNQQIDIWLRDNEIEHVEYLDIPIDFEQNMKVDSGADSVVGGVFDLIELFIIGIVGVITSSILGGAGTALLMAGPIGLVIGFIIGAAGALMAISSINTKEVHIPAWVLKMLITDDKINEAKEKFAEAINKKMSHAYLEKRPVLEDKIGLEVSVLVREIEKRLAVTAILKE